MVAKIRRKRIRFSAPEDQRADSVAESAREKQGHGFRAELFIDGTDQENDDPAHQQKTEIRQEDRNFGKENGLERDEENRQAPDDPEQDPARRPAENDETKWSVRPCDEDVDGAVIENPKDAQVFPKEQKEMQETTEQKGQEQTRPIDCKADDERGLVIHGRQCHQHGQRRNGQDRTDQMADGVEIFVALGEEMDGSRVGFCMGGINSNQIRDLCFGHVFLSLCFNIYPCLLRTFSGQCRQIPFSSCRCFVLNQPCFHRLAFHVKRVIAQVNFAVPFDRARNHTDGFE